MQHVKTAKYMILLQWVLNFVVLYIYGTHLATGAPDVGENTMTHTFCFSALFYWGGGA